MLNRAILSQAKSRATKAGFVALTLLVAGQAWAGGHGAEAAGDAADHHAPHIANWWNFSDHHAPALGWLMVTFVVFAGGMAFALRGPLSNYLEARSENIRSAIQEAADAKAEAEERAREYESRIAKLDDELVALKAEFKAQGEAERDRLKAAGEAVAARIAKDAEDTISAEMRRAEAALQAEAAKLAVQSARAALSSEVKADDQSRLHASFLQSLSA